MSPEFPDVTLCNLDPVNKRMADKYNLESYISVFSYLSRSLNLSVDQNSSEFIKELRTALHRGENVSNVPAYTASASHAIGELGFIQSTIKPTKNEMEMLVKTLLVECDMYDWSTRETGHQFCHR